MMNANKGTGRKFVLAAALIALATMSTQGLAQAQSCNLLAMLGVPLPPHCRQDHEPPAGTDPDELDALRLATAPFHSIDVAVAAGWDEEITGCLEDEELGGMGFHYVNFDQLLNGGKVSLLRPEALVYEPAADGSLHFVAVEYIVLEDDLPGTAEPPELLGQQFHFNHDFGLWALHVWVGRDNPSGLFADWNPDVSCEHAD